MDLENYLALMELFAHTASQKLFGSGYLDLDEYVGLVKQPLPALVEQRLGCALGAVDLKGEWSDEWLEDFNVELIKLEGKSHVHTICLERSAEERTVEFLTVVAQHQIGKWEDALEIICKYEQDQALPDLGGRGGYAFHGGQSYQLRVAPGALVWLIRVTSRGPVVISDPCREFAQELELSWWEAIIEDSARSSQKASQAPE